MFVSVDCVICVCVRVDSVSLVGATIRAISRMFSGVSIGVSKMLRVSERKELFWGCVRQENSRLSFLFLRVSG